MSEKMPQTPETLHLTRRELVKGVAAMGSVAVVGGLTIPLYEPIKDAYQKIESITSDYSVYGYIKEAYAKVESIGNDYSNDPFLADAVRIDRARLDELLSGSNDTFLHSYRVNEDWHDSPESLAEFAFFVDEPGPVYVELEGLQGNRTSLVIVEASVDDGEQYLIPLIRDPEDQSPITIQLGVHEAGRHQLSISTNHGDVESTELTPLFTRGSTDSFRSLVDMYQPVLYPRKASDIANNFPVRTLSFVYETPDEFAFTYWKECIGEDKEYGRFGTSAQQLHRTKRRTTDIDWDYEIRITKHTNQIVVANIAEPVHNRTDITSSATPRTPLQIASPNNNVRLISEEKARKNKGISIRPTIHTHDERWVELYSTTPAIARFSAIEHIRKGHLNPSNPADIEIIEETGLDASLFQN